MTIDIKTFNELKDLMEDDFPQLIEIYLSDGKKHIEHLQQAVDAADCDQLRHIAHTLKGTSMNIGVIDLAGHCQLLELQAAENSLQDARQLVETICQDFNQAEKFILNSF